MSTNASLEAISDFIFTSKYARHLPGLNRRETWDEAIDRVLKMHLQRFPDLPGERKEEVVQAFELVRQKICAPSMRSMQFGGDAVLKHHSKNYNCLKRSTEFITSEGVKSFEDFEDGDTCMVLGHSGNWRSATVHKYGVQKLYPVTVTRSKSSSTIWATKNHRWMLRNGTMTDNLEEGMSLRGASNVFSEFNFDSAEFEEKLYWCYGYVFGDGSTVKKNGVPSGTVLRLCKHDRHHVERFKELNFTVASFTLEGDPFVYIGDYTKTTPEPGTDPKLLTAFVKGYCDADAAKNRNEGGNDYHSIQATGEKYTDFIRDFFPAAGMYVVSEKDLTGQVTNYGIRKFTRFFRITHSFNNGPNCNAPFVVKEIGTDYIEEEVWCLEVEEDETFTLPNGLITGNCAVRHIDSLRSFAEVFYLLLNGCGVGFGLNKKFLGRLPDLVNEEDKTGSIVVYTIEDTIEGWANSMEALLQCYFRNTPYTGKKIEFDYSKIRKKGSPLKTTGGKAPGYAGLKQTHIKVKNLLNYLIEDLKLSRIRSIDVYDILMHVSDAVLSGGIRRAATSAIFEKDDELMLNAKVNLPVDKVYSFDFSHEETKGGFTTKYHTGRVLYKGKKVEVTVDDWALEHLRETSMLSWFYLEPQRARANNSVLLLRGTVTLEEFKFIVARTKEFGEPGFVFADHEDTLYNPCQPGSAKLLTPKGITQMKDISEGDVIWSSQGWTKVVKKWSTGVKPVYRYQTSAGAFLGTENHKLVQDGVKVEAQDCTSIDVLVGGFSDQKPNLNPQDILDGLIIGDGTLKDSSQVLLCIGENDTDYFNSEVKDLIHNKYETYTYKVTTTVTPNELDTLPARTVPERFIFGDRDKILGFLKGIYSANGSIVRDRITLKSCSFELITQIQVMLSSIGIRSYFTTNQEKEVEFSNGIYTCKESYDLNITCDRGRFFSLIGFCQGYKTEKLIDIVSHERRFHPGKTSFDIIKTTYIQDEEVFDITVDNSTHTYWTEGCNVSNCFEVAFIPVTPTGECGTQYCNLTTINGAKITSFEIFREAALATVIIGTLQATFTDFPFMSPAAKILTEHEALLGCSITGMFDNPDILLNPEYQQKIVAEMKEVNETWANLLDIKPAARITVIKPEGSSSLVFQCASGIHPHHSQRYFRRVQVNKLDNVAKYFSEVNPHAVEESVWSAAKTDNVLTFPIEVQSKNAKFKADLTALQHLELIKSTQTNWVVPGTTKYNEKPLVANTSCTVLVGTDEWDEVEEYIFDNQKLFAAVSLLPRSGDKDYMQAPMESITTEQDEAKWQELIANFKLVDYTQMIETSDNTALNQEASCVGGACELV